MLSLVRYLAREKIPYGIRSHWLCSMFKDWTWTNWAGPPAGKAANWFRDKEMLLSFSNELRRPSGRELTELPSILNSGNWTQLAKDLGMELDVRRLYLSYKITLFKNMSFLTIRWHAWQLLRKFLIHELSRSRTTN